MLHLGVVTARRGFPTDLCWVWSPHMLVGVWEPEEELMHGFSAPVAEIQQDRLLGR